MTDSLLAQLADLLARVDAPPRFTIHTLLSCADRPARPGIHSRSATLLSCADRQTQPAIHAPLDLGGSR